MKYILEIKDEKSGSFIESNEYNSITDISSALGCTYSCARKNFMYALNQNEKPAKKYSQVLFDKNIVLNQKYNMKIK